MACLVSGRGKVKPETQIAVQRMLPYPMVDGEAFVLVGQAWGGWGFGVGDGGSVSWLPYIGVSLKAQARAPGEEGQPLFSTALYAPSHWGSALLVGVSDSLSSFPSFSTMRGKVGPTPDIHGHPGPAWPQCTLSCSSEQEGSQTQPSEQCDE